MSENSYLDLFDEIMRAAGEYRRTAPRRKEHWRQIRNVVDGQGKVLGKVKLTRSKMTTLKSATTGQRLYRVKGAGWLLETKNHNMRGAGTVMPLSDDQAHQWLRENGWTVLIQEEGKPAVNYQPQKGERLYIEGGSVVLDTLDAKRVDVVAEKSDVQVDGWPVRWRGSEGAALAYDHGNLDPEAVAEEQELVAAQEAGPKPEPVAENDPADLNPVNTSGTELIVEETTVTVDF